MMFISFLIIIILCGVVGAIAFLRESHKEVSELSAEDFTITDDQ